MQTGQRVVLWCSIAKICAGDDRGNNVGYVQREEMVGVWREATPAIVVVSNTHTKLVGLGNQKYASVLHMHHYYCNYVVIILENCRR